MKRNLLPRVGFVSHSPHLAGAERALLNLLQHLPDREIEPVAIFPTGDGPVKKAVSKGLGIPVFELTYGFSVPTTRQTALTFNCRVQQELTAFAQLYRDLELDAVIVNTTVLYPACAASVDARIPLLVHSHGVVSPRLFPDLDLGAWHKLEAVQLNIADKVLVPSSWVATHYTATDCLSEADVAVLPNGTELPALVDGGLPPQASGIPEFVMLCTLEPNKGVHLFFNAAKDVLTRRPGCARFTVYGDGSPEFCKSLVAFISQHGLESSCAVRPRTADTDSVYRRCRAAIVASEVESFSLVTIEAMSYAKPVIATRCGGPDDIVEDGKTGYLIPVGDSASLADSIMRLIDDPGLCLRMGMACRERVALQYDITATARTYVNHILHLCTINRSPDCMRRKRLLITLIASQGTANPPSLTAASHKFREGRPLRARLQCLLKWIAHYAKSVFQ